MSRRDMLTVDTQQFEEQLKYLSELGYHFITVHDLLHASTFSKKGILLTFDDGYVNNLELGSDILKKYNAKATLFVPTAFVGKTSSWDKSAEPLMTLSQLQSLDRSIFELAPHSHAHQNYKNLTVEQIRDDLAQIFDFFNENQLPYTPAFSYPYGGRPKNKKVKAKMFQVFDEFGIKFAFRIGNRINAWPLKDPYQIERIDVRGTDSFEIFKRKVRWGKVF